MSLKKRGISEEKKVRHFNISSREHRTKRTGQEAQYKLRRAFKKIASEEKRNVEISDEKKK